MSGSALCVWSVKFRGLNIGGFVCVLVEKGYGFLIVDAVFLDVRKNGYASSI